MTTFQILARTEITSNYSIVSINEYKTANTVDKEQIVKDFIKPGNFKHEDFHSRIRLNTDPGAMYLGHALNLEQLELADFKTYTKKQAIGFLDQSLSKDSTQKAEIEERYLLDKLISVISKTESDHYYFISKYFFDTSLDYEAYFNNEKLLYDGIIYDPYFLIIWFNEAGILHVCEYLSD